MLIKICLNKHTSRIVSGSHTSALGYPLWGLSSDSAPIQHYQIRLVFHFTPYRIPFQLQIKFQGIESLSHSSGLADCPSSSLLSQLPVILLKGVDAFHQHQIFAQGRRCHTLSADGYMESPLCLPVRRSLHGVDASSLSLLKFARGRRFLPQSANGFIGAALSPQSAELCTGSTLSHPIC